MRLRLCDKAGVRLDRARDFLGTVAVLRPSRPSQRLAGNKSEQKRSRNDALEGV